jgi:hypothetical protein
MPPTCLIRSVRRMKTAQQRSATLYGGGFSTCVSSRDRPLRKTLHLSSHCPSQWISRKALGLSARADVAEAIEHFGCKRESSSCRSRDSLPKRPSSNRPTCPLHAASWWAYARVHIVGQQPSPVRPSSSGKLLTGWTVLTISEYRP